MKTLLILFSLLVLTSCGQTKTGGDDGPSPNPGVACNASLYNCASLDYYKDQFTDRYGIPVNYLITFDTAGETGGSGSAGTTVGVCRVWTNGYKEVLINRTWWEDQQKEAKTLSLNNGNYIVNNYSYNFGDLEQRKNAEINLNLSNGTNFSDVNLITSSNNKFEIRSKTCSESGGNQTCTVKLKFNTLENEELGVYTTSISNGNRTIQIQVEVIASPTSPYYGELSRKVLIYHEIGHCSLDRPHNSNRDTSVSPNRPESMMYPTINPIVYWYSQNQTWYDYYENELIDNREDLNASYFSMAMQSEEEVMPDENKDHGDCVQFMD